MLSFVFCSFIDNYKDCTFENLYNCFSNLNSHSENRDLHKGHWYLSSLFFFNIMLMISTQYKESRITKCSYTDCRHWGTKKQRENGEEKKNRTCLQGRLKIKRNTIPACIWLEARPPLPPLEWLGANPVKIHREPESLFCCCPVIVWLAHCWGGLSL